MAAGGAVFCVAPTGQRPTDPPIEPTKIFDNVYVIGKRRHVVYVVQTSDGLLMFDVECQPGGEQLLGLQKLGLDPSQVKAIVVAHGHADHFGGAPYFQQKYGTRVYVSTADWDLIENPPPARVGAEVRTVPGPTRDQAIVRGPDHRARDLKVQTVALPGHTPGAWDSSFPSRTTVLRHGAMFGGRC